MKKITIFLVLVFSFFIYSSAFAQTYTLGELVDGDLITTSENPDIYIVKLVGSKKFKRLILNPDIFNSYGHLKWEDVKTVSQTDQDQFMLSELVIEVNADGSVADPKVYIVTSASGSDSGERRWLNLTASEFEQAGYDWDSIYQVNHTEALPSFYPEKTELRFSDVKQNTTPEVVSNDTESQDSITTETTTNTEETTTTPEEENVIISDVKIEPGLVDAVISWSTNIPTTGKVFITGYGKTQVFFSISGTSGKHIANISGLVSGSEYSYGIESINGNNKETETGALETSNQTLTIKRSDTNDPRKFDIESERPFKIKKLAFRTYCLCENIEYKVANLQYSLVDSLNTTRSIAENITVVDGNVIFTIPNDFQNLDFVRIRFNPNPSKIIQNEISDITNETHILDTSNSSILGESGEPLKVPEFNYNFDWE